MGQLKQLDVLSWELKHKSFKIVCFVHIVCCTNCRTFAPHHFGCFGDRGSFEVSTLLRTQCNDETGRLAPFSLDFSLIYGSNCLLFFLTGRWYVWTSGPDHWCCAEELGKGQKKRKENEEKSNNLWHNHYPCAFLSHEACFWSAHSALCGHPLLNVIKLMNKWSLIKRAMIDVQMARFGI